MKEILALRGQDKDEFYQAKYNHYKKFNIWALIASCFMFIILFPADWLAGIQWATLLCRCVVIIPLLGVILAYRKTDNYKVMSVISFALVSVIIGCNIWLNFYMSDVVHSGESFLAICFIMLLVSFGTPPIGTALFQWGGVTAIILIMQTGNQNYFKTVIYLCQITILLNIVDFIVTKLYYKQYITENKLEWALFHDPLTQVFNRHKFNNIIEAGYDLTHISENISILIADIDCFKRINDTYGHDKGDEVLKAISSAIKRNLRKRDMVFRWGGEEFVAIMPDCDFEQALLIAERMRKVIADLDNGICAVTISVGAAYYNGGNCMEVIKKADEALYQAKQDGRNRVAAYTASYM